MQPKTEKVQNKDVRPTWWAFFFAYLPRLLSAFSPNFVKKSVIYRAPQLTYREPLLPQCIFFPQRDLGLTSKLSKSLASLETPPAQNTDTENSPGEPQGYA